MKKRGICLLPDACYLSELNVPGKPNRTNLGECAAIQRFLSTHPNENLAILTPYRNQRALLAGTAKKSSYPQEVSLTVHRAQEREWDTVLFSVVDTTGKFFTTTLNRKRQTSPRIKGRHPKASCCSPRWRSIILQHIAFFRGICGK